MVTCKNWDNNIVIIINFVFPIIIIVSLLWLYPSRCYLQETFVCSAWLLIGVASHIMAGRFPPVLGSWWSHWGVIASVFTILLATASVYYYNVVPKACIVDSFLYPLHSMWLTCYYTYACTMMIALIGDIHSIIMHAIDWKTHVKNEHDYNLSQYADVQAMP